MYQACKAAYQAVDPLAVMDSNVRWQEVCTVHAVYHARAKGSVALGKQLFNMWGQLHCHGPWAIPADTTALLLPW